MRKTVRFADLKVGDEFLHERGEGRLVRFRKIASPAAVLGQDFAARNAIELGGDAEAVITICDDVVVLVFTK